MSSSDFSPISFQGINGKECEDFISAIHKHAFAEGRDDDPQWMLRFARSRLEGQALRWYSRLEASAKGDWDLFLQALFDSYPSNQGAQERESIATPTWLDPVSNMAQPKIS